MSDLFAALFISAAVASGSKALLVSSSYSFDHYSHICRKYGVDLASLSAQGICAFVSATSCTAAGDDYGSAERGIELLSALVGRSLSPSGGRVAVVIDSLSSIVTTVFNGDTSCAIDWLRFVRDRAFANGGSVFVACQSEAETGGGPQAEQGSAAFHSPSWTLSAALAAGADETSAFTSDWTPTLAGALSGRVAHLSDTLIDLQPLRSGYSHDIAGQMRVVQKDGERSLGRMQAMFLRVNDSGAVSCIASPVAPS